MKLQLLETFLVSFNLVVKMDASLNPTGNGVDVQGYLHQQLLMVELMLRRQPAGTEYYHLPAKVVIACTHRSNSINIRHTLL